MGNMLAKKVCGPEHPYKSIFVYMQIGMGGYRRILRAHRPARLTKL